MANLAGNREGNTNSYLNPFEQSNWWLPGGLVVAAIFSLVGLPLLALLSQIDATVLSDPYTDPWLRRVIGFSFYQATLSTALSLGFALSLAHILAHRPSFPFRQLLVNLFSVALIIPTIVAVFGIVAVYGRTGWVNQLFEWIGLTFRIPLYGLTGILLAHVFFNLPFATRVLLQICESIPDVNRRVAAQLGMSRWQQFRIIEWPQIKQQLPSIAVLIFTLCFTSFAIVMTLGGGPSATTIEVAIYQALRFDFNLGAAVALGLVQIAFCSLLIAVAAKYNQSALFIQKNQITSQSYCVNSGWQRTCDYTLIIVAMLFVIAPLTAIFVEAMRPALWQVLLSPTTIQAIVNTVWVALASGILSLSLGFLLLLTTRHMIVRIALVKPGRMIEMLGMSILVVPPVVLGTGLFLLLRPFADVFSLALLLVVLVNALMGLPFVLRVLGPPMTNSARQHDKLCASLGLARWDRLRWVELPVLRRPIGLSLAIASTLSAGDLTVIALFGSERLSTLPLLLYQRMGSYRLYDAAATAMLLLVLCFIIFFCIERWIGGRRATAS